MFQHGQNFQDPPLIGPLCLSQLKSLTVIIKIMKGPGNDANSIPLAHLKRLCLPPGLWEPCSSGRGRCLSTHPAGSRHPTGPEVPPAECSSQPSAGPAAAGLQVRLHHERLQDASSSASSSSSASGRIERGHGRVDHQVWLLQYIWVFHRSLQSLWTYILPLKKWENRHREGVRIHLLHLINTKHL